MSDLFPIKLKGGTAAVLTALNPVLVRGRACYETDTTLWKIGDGVTPWNTLPYRGAPAVASTPDGDYAIEFDRTKAHNVNCGKFWIPGTVYTNFFWEAWVKPFDLCEYWISAGYGGAHDILAGFSGGTGWTSVTGNVRNALNTTQVIFSGFDLVQTNTWNHIGIGYDGANVNVFINGVWSAKYAKTDGRMTASGFETTLFLGGSDHSNFHGRIKRVRGIENASPFPNPGALNYLPYKPHRRFAASFDTTKAAFIMDFSQKGEMIVDMSAGFEGSTHPGILASLQTANNEFISRSGQTNLPVFVYDPLVQSNTSLVAPATPAGALIFDPFTRNDVTYAWNETTLGLGSAPLGSLAPVVWEDSETFGILSGKVFKAADNSTFTRVQAQISNHRVSIDVSGQTGANAVLSSNYADPNNFAWWYLDSGGISYLFLVKGGVQTNVGSYAFAAGLTTAYNVSLERTAANVFIVKINGTAVITYTDVLAGAPLTGTKTGFRLYDRVRATNFTVMTGI